jgi:hypothetical protein
VSAFLLVAAGWTVGYIIACAVWPYRRCGRCRGVGRLHSPSGRAWRPCRRCGGEGHTVRAGRGFVEWFTGGRRT